MAELTINKAFQEVFGKELETHGFYKMKRSKYYVKLINGEIFQYISYANESPGIKGYRGFTMEAGMLTIYSQSLEPKELHRRSGDLLTYGWKKYPYEERRKFSLYIYNDTNTLIQKLREGLEKTKAIIIPLFAEVEDLNSYIEFQKEFRLDILSGADQLKEDSLLLIKTNNHDSFMGFFEKALSERLESAKKGECGGDYDYHYRSLYDGIIKNVAQPRDKVYNDEKLYARVMEELERRKEQNLKILQSHGVI
ncbi:MAG: hypothetical protein HFI34_06230 [Lachnospiraceae bacterium]|nr:hypothetical protein [Lachnospiraceae bacterium]